MNKITITFQEEGNTPIILELPESTCQALELYIEEMNRQNRKPLEPSIPGQPDPEPYPPKYTGKADLFLQHTSTTLLEPIISKYKTQIIDSKRLNQLIQLEIQKKTIEDELANSFKPKLL